MTSRSEILAVYARLIVPEIAILIGLGGTLPHTPSKNRRLKAAAKLNEQPMPNRRRVVTRGIETQKENDHEQEQCAMFRR